MERVKLYYKTVSNILKEPALDQQKLQYGHHP